MAVAGACAAPFPHSTNLCHTRATSREERCSETLTKYLVYADYFRRVGTNKIFNDFITFVIIVAGILVGIGTEIPSETNPVSRPLLPQRSTTSEALTSSFPLHCTLLRRRWRCSI